MGISDRDQYIAVIRLGVASPLQQPDRVFKQRRILLSRGVAVESKSEVSLKFDIAGLASASSSFSRMASVESVESSGRPAGFGEFLRPSISRRMVSISDRLNALAIKKPPMKLKTTAISDIAIYFPDIQSDSIRYGLLQKKPPNAIERRPS
jgi:hypothetical protein